MFPAICMLKYVTFSINYWGLIHVPYHVHTPFQLAQYKPYPTDYITKAVGAFVSLKIYRGTNKFSQ